MPASRSTPHQTGKKGEGGTKVSTPQRGDEGEPPEAHATLPADPSIQPRLLRCQLCSSFAALPQQGLLHVLVCHLSLHAKTRVCKHGSFLANLAYFRTKLVPVDVLGLLTDANSACLRMR